MSSFAWLVVKMIVQFNVGFLAIYLSGFPFLGKNNFPKFNPFLRSLAIICIFFFGINVQILLNTKWELPENTSYQILWCDENKNSCFLQNDTEKPFRYFLSEKEKVEFLVGKNYLKMK